MPLRIIGTTPQEMLPPNKRRAVASVQFIPSSIISGNTGLVYGKFGSPPDAGLGRNSWDFVLSQGATDGTNLYETRDKALITKALWLISDTAAQSVNVTETESEEY